MIDTQELLAGVDLADVVGRYVELTPDGREHKGLCPFHADGNPSFRVVPEKGFYHCFGCGAHGDVIDFVREIEHIDFKEAARRLGARELPAEPVAPVARATAPPVVLWRPITPVPDDAPALDPARLWNPKRDKYTTLKPTMQWAYRDASGRLLGYVLRAEFEDGGKWTPTVTWCEGPGGDRRWCLVPFPAPRPLWGLDALAARPDGKVLVVEGEKAAAAATGLLSAFVVVTWPGGTGGVKHTDWSALAGRDVLLWPDADAPGLTCMQNIAERIEAARIRVVDVTGIEAGTDLADFAADGWTASRIAEWARPRISVWAKKNGAEGSDAVKSTLEDKAAPAAVRPAVQHTTAVDGNNVLHLDEHRPVPVDPDDADVPPAFSDDALAAAFTVKHGYELRHVAAWGRWLRWDGRRWAVDDTLHVIDLARRVCRHMATQAGEVGAKPSALTSITSGRTVASVVSLARSDRQHAATIDQWDADAWTLNTPAGVVDLRTGDLRVPRKDDYVTKITRVAPAGDCPTWLAFLAQATDGDTELQGFLQRMAGYSLTGSTREHALFFVYGTGGNGKGTFLNTLEWLLGDYANVASMDVFTESRNDRHPTELASLMGARLVTAQETEEGRRWAESRIKALTGGDPIRARFMRQDEFQFMPQFKLVIAGNHKPGLRNVDEAIRRRLHLIPFTVTVPAARRDPELADKLRAEAPGILAWAIEGCRQWVAGGLAAPASVRAATDDYLAQEDVLGAWLEECCDLHGSGTSSVLYGSYRAWAERNGEYVMPQKRWSQQMETRGHAREKRGGMMRYNGVMVKPDPDEVPPEREW